MAGGYGGNEKVLDFRPEAPISADQRASWIGRITRERAADPCGSDAVSRTVFAKAMASAGLYLASDNSVAYLPRSIGVGFWSRFSLSRGAYHARNVIYRALGTL